MNSLEYNALNKPQIIVIKAIEILQYNGWSTNSTRKGTVCSQECYFLP